MTDTKMREAFERWAEGYDIRLVRDGVFADDYADGDAEIAWRAWQAAQSVAVVDTDKTGICIDGVHMAPVVTSIPAPELERLRKDAERGRLLIDRGEWIRRNHDTDEAHALLAIRLPYDADLSCKATCEDAIDAAMQERQS